MLKVCQIMMNDISVKNTLPSHTIHPNALSKGVHASHVGTQRGTSVKDVKMGKCFSYEMAFRYYISILTALEKKILYFVLNVHCNMFMCVCNHFIQKKGELI